MSLRPLLDDPEKAWKKGAFTQVEHGVQRRAERQASRQAAAPWAAASAPSAYRYTEWGEGQHGVELYDHRPIRTRHNLANDPNSADVMRELKALLHAGWKPARPASAAAGP